MREYSDGKIKKLALTKAVGLTIGTLAGIIGIVYAVAVYPSIVLAALLISGVAGLLGICLYFMTSFFYFRIVTTSEERKTRSNRAYDQVPLIRSGRIPTETSWRL